MRAVGIGEVYPHPHGQSPGGDPIRNADVRRPERSCQDEQQGTQSDPKPRLVYGCGKHSEHGRTEEFLQQSRTPSRATFSCRPSRAISLPSTVDRRSPIMSVRSLASHSVLVVASLSAAIVAARADQLQDIMQRKELRCGTFADVPPFAAPDSKSREMVGFDVDLCGAIAKSLGVVAKITPLSVDARVPEVKL